MTAYFEYLRELVTRFFSDLGRFFAKAFASPWADVPGNFEAYNSFLASHKDQFGFGGWLLFVIFLLLVIAIIGAALFGLFILIRKYVRFVRRELDKDELRNQVERLNYELYQAIAEKDKILNLKTTYMGVKPEDMKKEDKEVLDEISSRFPKLVRVDNQYKGVDLAIPNKDGLSLEYSHTDQKPHKNNGTPKNPRPAFFLRQFHHNAVSDLFLRYLPSCFQT